MTTSKHLKLPFIQSAQAGKHITHNEAMAIVDTLAQLAVLDRDLAVPPSDPETGDRYIVATAPTGAWAGKAGQIAAFDGAVWMFHEPERGWLTYVIDEDGLLVWTGTTWMSTIGLAGAVPQLGINTAADPTNRLSLKSDAVLFSHDDATPGSGDMRLKLNKSAPANSAAVLWQTGFSGRAELGTAGDDKLHLKASADGSGWTVALVVDSLGRIAVGHDSPLVALDVAGPIRLKSYPVAGLPGASAAAGQLIYVSDEAGGAVVAFSDGVEWRRVTDRAVVG